MNARTPTTERLILASFFALALGACGEETEPQDNGQDTTGTCRSDDACRADEICVEGECVLAEGCSVDTCPDGVCVEGVCNPTEEEDAGDTDVEDTDTVDGGTDTDTDPDDTGADADSGEEDATEDTTEPPDEVTFTSIPADGDIDVAVDTEVSVTFNQPMNPATFIADTVQLEPYDGEGVYIQYDYAPDTNTLLMDLCTLEDGADGVCNEGTELQPYMPYTLTLGQFIRSDSGVRLGADYQVRFVTSASGSTTFYDQLASIWSPVFYQGLSENNLDTFTDVYFDGDTDPTNNLDSATGPNPASVYYNVIETPSHFYITYTLYYPGRRQSPVSVAEHDMSGIQLIIGKTENDPTGALRAFTTFQGGRYYRWALESNAYGPGLDIADPNLRGRLNSDYLEDGRHISVYIEAENHQLCIPNAGASDCDPTTSGAFAPFSEQGTGLVLRAGERADRIGDEASDNLSYQLLDFVSAFWPNRNDTSGDSALFGGSFRYSAPAEVTSSGGDVLESRPGDRTRLPSSLSFDHDGDSFGEMPFAFARASAFPDSDAGVWFIDPAWMNSELFEFPEFIQVDYCYNPFLGVDVRDELEGCTSESLELP